MKENENNTAPITPGLSVAALEARRAYHRRYQQEHKEQAKERARRYWERKAAKTSDNESPQRQDAEPDLKCPDQKDNDNEPERLSVLAERLRSLRGEMTQVAFADLIGVERSTLALYLSGDRLPGALAIRNIARATHVSADWLLGLSDAPLSTFESVTDTATKRRALAYALAQSLRKTGAESIELPISLTLDLEFLLMSIAEEVQP